MCILYLPFNRTRVECKLEKLINLLGLKDTFNRTRVECK